VYRNRHTRRRPAERDVWRYRQGLEISSDLSGFAVEARDGGIGEVVECSMGVAGSYLVVDACRWAARESVMLPAGLIERIDFETETVYLDRTKDAIGNAPEFDRNGYRAESYRRALGSYFRRAVPAGPELGPADTAFLGATRRRASGACRAEGRFRAAGRNWLPRPSGGSGSARAARRSRSSSRTRRVAGGFAAPL